MVDNRARDASPAPSSRPPFAFARLAQHLEAKALLQPILTDPFCVRQEQHETRLPG